MAGVGAGTAGAAQLQGFVDPIREMPSEKAARFTQLLAKAFDGVRIGWRPRTRLKSGAYREVRQTLDKSREAERRVLNLNLKLPSGETPLHYYLYNEGELTDGDGESPPTALLEMLRIPTIRGLINSPAHNGLTPIHAATSAGSMRALLDAGADPSVPSDAGQGCRRQRDNSDLSTPLHEAARAFKHKSVEMLLDYGADVHQPNMFNELPIDAFKASFEVEHGCTPEQLREQDPEAGAAYDVMIGALTPRQDLVPAAGESEGVTRAGDGYSCKYCGHISYSNREIKRHVETCASKLPRRR